MTVKKRIASVLLSGLIAGAAIGTFAGTAEAFNRPNRTGSRRGGDEQTFFALFNLVTLDLDGNSIEDMNPSLEAGYFSGAVEDYVAFDSFIDSGIVFGGEFAANDTIDEVFSYNTFDELISGLEERGVTGNSLGPLDLNATRLGDEIEYEFIDPVSSNSIFDITVPSSFSMSNPEDLVNDLSTIVENFDLPATTGEGGFVQRIVAEKTFIETIPDNDSKSVPEPSAVGGLVILMASGFRASRAKKSSSDKSVQSL